METSYLKTLELDKIIARAAEGCVCRELSLIHISEPTRP